MARIFDMDIAEILGVERDRTGQLDKGRRDLLRYYGQLCEKNQIKLISYARGLADAEW